MVTIPARCWQVAAGDGNRNYADICLKYDVILMGPSYSGTWLDSLSCVNITAKRQLEKDNWTPQKINGLEKFVSVKDGDLVVLRMGMSEVYGVGIVRGMYEFNELFSDVDGWDLAHTHRVEWVWPRQKNKNDTTTTFEKVFNRGTIQRLDPNNPKTSALFKWIRSLPEVTGRSLALTQPPGGKLEYDQLTLAKYKFNGAGFPRENEKDLDPEKTSFEALERKIYEQSLEA